jgi:exodeoxyribonuclease V alpha subunit
MLKAQTTEAQYGSDGLNVPQKRNITWTLTDLPGIGPARAQEIIDGLGDGDERIAKTEVQQNPYSLILVEGIGFKIADKIATEFFNVDLESPRRHYAGNQFITSMHGVLTLREYRREREALSLFNTNFETSGVDIEEGRVWHPQELEAELGLADWISSALAAGIENTRVRNDQLELIQKTGLDTYQAAAVGKALKSKVMIMTGGAGCGKTKVISTICKCLLLENRSARVMAFAGKAADRCREALDSEEIAVPATTIHRALQYRPKHGFTLEQFEEQVIFIDECSMVTNFLLWQVVKRLRPDGVLVLVGDPGQLPPIGYGNPFIDLIDLECNRVHLQKNHRQKDVQGILELANGIRESKRTPFDEACVEPYLSVADAEFEDRFIELIQKHAVRDYDQWQCITWKNVDVDRFNLLAQKLVNPDGMPLFEFPMWSFGRGERGRPKQLAYICEGDKVLITKNDTQKGIFNGQLGEARGLCMKRLKKHNPETGKVEEYGREVEHIEVHVNGVPVHIPTELAGKYLQLGYVITVHKAQGSDWGTVLVVMPGEIKSDIAQRWYYTAVTRAKNRLVLVTSLSTLKWWMQAATAAPKITSTLVKRFLSSAA